jgi:hypothetical protein
VRFERACVDHHGIAGFAPGGWRREYAIEHILEAPAQEADALGHTRTVDGGGRTAHQPTLDDISEAADQPMVIDARHASRFF